MHKMSLSNTSGFENKAFVTCTKATAVSQRKNFSRDFNDAYQNGRRQWYTWKWKDWSLGYKNTKSQELLFILNVSDQTVNSSPIKCIKHSNKCIHTTWAV